MDKDELPALIYVCKDMQGNHIGGPDCFCCPTILTADMMEQEIDLAILSNERLN